MFGNTLPVMLFSAPSHMVAGYYMPSHWRIVRNKYFPCTPSPAMPLPV
ncbi:hypothetical protein [Lucifera butyrica]|nr:hypothetical protein [Lucifera butyrica]